MNYTIHTPLRIMARPTQKDYQQLTQTCPCVKATAVRWKMHRCSTITDGDVMSSGSSIMHCLTTKAFWFKFLITCTVSLLVVSDSMVVTLPGWSLTKIQRIVCPVFTELSPQELQAGGRREHFFFQISNLRCVEKFNQKRTGSDNCYKWLKLVILYI